MLYVSITYLQGKKKYNSYISLPYFCSDQTSFSTLCEKNYNGE